MSHFCPSILPEDPTPKDHQSCQECGLYTHRSRMVWGEGNPSASIMVVLDNPGAREDREENPFLCGTRQTLQLAANEVNLKADELYITYVLKRKPTRAYEKEKTRHICIRHLQDQLAEKKPDIILCLGNVAVQSFFKKPEAEVKTLRGSWHEIQGFKAAVAYHPLAVRRRPNLWPSFIEDWKLVADRFHRLEK
ncbi:uracil-DNA glycosylase [Mesobacillus foraminis]|uniref:DNA polymerase n=1 Tax=Mesobacillus foraminis TaxID=279826 RepID=A0A4R2BGP6_9BACI|nr:uracil-DNA glycosylase [Mesobacillus foraminis]TCN26036.1 DNA polymerase [Mesobacillus foraminis]